MVLFVICTDGGKLVGYLTSMDLLVSPREAALRNIVRRCELVVRETDAYDDAILAMREKQLTYAPVVDSNDIVVGMELVARMHFCGHRIAVLNRGTTLMVGGGNHYTH